GAMDAGTGNAITGPADRAVADAQAGRTHQAAMQMQQAAAVIADGIQNGSISQSEGATLQGDIATLDSALGLNGTTTTPTTAPGPGDGNGNGPGGGQNG
ncbi:MAG TPA: hypothetical protein VN799_06900, partial [Acidimicrobiales bacterium]|nr:hypothetical protein [Acidimicrobiales bacterium]